MIWTKPPKNYVPVVNLQGCTFQGLPSSESPVLHSRRRFGPPFSGSFHFKKWLACGIGLEVFPPIPSPIPHTPYLPDLCISSIQKSPVRTSAITAVVPAESSGLRTWAHVTHQDVGSPWPPGWGSRRKPTHFVTVRGVGGLAYWSISSWWWWKSLIANSSCVPKNGPT